ncbi:hypothetical protein [Bradyrhizobium sp. USDA 4469]
MVWPKPHVWTARGLICLAATLGGISMVGAAEEIKDVKFSKEEMTLLKRLDQIQKGAGVSSSMLKATPFIQLFGSPAPVDVAITIVTNDWDKIFGALKSLKKVQACQTVKEIDLWKDADGNDYSSSKSQSFFEQVRAQADTEC